METNIAVVILSTGTNHKINQETYDQICLADKDDFIRLPDGSTFKNSAVMDILGIADFEKQHPEKLPAPDYHQPYSQLPAVGFEGIINQTKRLKGLEALAKGLAKAKTKLGGKTPKLDKLLEMARTRYADIKTGRITEIGSKKVYTPKYQKWEEAKAAGVI